MNKLFSDKKLLISALIVLLAGIILGYFLFSPGDNSGKSKHAEATTEKKPQIWTCSMHPEIKKPGPGKCPKCFMDLIPLKEDSDNDNPRLLKLSKAAQQLAEVKTSAVYLGPATRTLRLPGTVQLDETRVKHVTAWVGGRIEKLYVNYTGIPVSLNDHMAEFYSPELIAAQEELQRTVGNENLHRAVIERLLRWGISTRQINSFKSSESVSELVTINSPTAGIVIEQSVKEGMYVTQGTRLFSIADMKRLWLVASVYERDIQWLRYGQDVECEFEAYPGRVFPGKIAFISPVLSPTSRTIDARINIDNEQGLLKPGMFGRVKIKVSIGKKGEVINPELAGKWISPMHPEIIKDGPGQCDICGMDLVPVESLGISTDVGKELPMIVPETAILWSGPRSIAFKETDKKTRLYEPVEVKVGPKVDGGYLIFSGLKKGDVVVTEGAFKLDAEQQIRAKTSMMDPHRDISDASARVSNFSDEEVKIIEQQIKFNLDISAGLAQDDLESARKSAHHAHEHLPELKSTGNQDLAAISDKLMPVLMQLMQSEDLKSAREDLFTLTPILKELITLVENQLSFSVHEDFCPMAFDNKGATWFQSASELANPYYGAMMLRCGETRKVWNEGKD